jgi:hypothetical protein
VVSLFEARQGAINRLHDIVQMGGNENAVAAAEVLLTCSLSDPSYVPCDCPMCDPDNDDRDEIPDDVEDSIDFSPFIRYEVFFQ